MDRKRQTDGESQRERARWIQTRVREVGNLLAMEGSLPSAWFSCGDADRVETVRKRLRRFSLFFRSFCPKSLCSLLFCSRCLFRFLAASSSLAQQGALHALRSSLVPMRTAN